MPTERNEDEEFRPSRPTMIRDGGRTAIDLIHSAFPSYEDDIQFNSQDEAPRLVAEQALLLDSALRHLGFEGMNGRLRDLTLRFLENAYSTTHENLLPEGCAESMAKRHMRRCDIAAGYVMPTIVDFREMTGWRKQIVAATDRQR